MNDAKTKLGQMKAYEYDASKFKSELKSKLMREYRAKYGIEEDFRAEVRDRKSFFSFNKLVFTPIMAVLVLAVFISYEYVNKPMTAYAYLKQVEKHNSDLKDGLKVHTIHTVNGYTLDVEVLRDKDGNLEVNVSQEGNEVESFVMHDGVLYVKEDIKPNVEMATEAFVSDESSTIDKAGELTSILNSLVLADLADPQDEWKDIMNRADVTFEEKEDGLVHISYEENLDGKVFVNDFSFRDFAPVRKIRTQKHLDGGVNRSMVAKNNVETIEYRDIKPAETKVKKPSEYVVFVQNKEFNEKMFEFVNTDVDDLVREYNDLSDKESYFAWDKKEKSALPIVEPEVAAMMSDVAEPLLLEGEFEREVKVVRELPTITVPTLVEAPGTVETMGLPVIDLPEHTLSAPVLSDEIKMPQHKALVRDAYLENVFYDLLKDDEHPKLEIREEDVPRLPSVDKHSDDTNDVPKIIEAPHVDVIVPIKELPVIDPPKVDLPSVTPIDRHSEIPAPVDGTEHNGSSDNALDTVDLIDHSIPEPYMAEPMDNPADYIESEPTKTPSYMELLKDKEAMQDDLANRRLQLRMQEQTEQLNPQERVVTPIEPKSEFKRVE